MHRGPAAYRAPWWLPSRHLQTVYAALALKGRPPAYRRETWRTPDGDRLELDWTEGPEAAPLVVLFHGLEGNSRSSYAAALMRAVHQRGWRGVVPHFRGCGGAPNLLARAYHSGDAREIGWIVTRLARVVGQPVYVVGVSLGGNALLKWLGQEGEGVRPYVRRAAAVCAPLDLVAAGASLRRGFNRFYTAQFLRTLKPKTLEKSRRFPGLFDPVRIARARDFDTFDDAYTAPMHGYRGVLDYWTRASSKPDLPHIAVPTLLINPRNDPFLPARHLPATGDVSPHVVLEQPAHGGHVGFVSGPFPGNLDWLPARILDFFSSPDTLPTSDSPPAA